MPLDKPKGRRFLRRMNVDMAGSLQHSLTSGQPSFLSLSLAAISLLSILFLILPLKRQIKPSEWTF